jgi:hypothetical protein
MVNTYAIMLLVEKLSRTVCLGFVMPCKRLHHLGFLGLGHGAKWS